MPVIFLALSSIMLSVAAQFAMKAGTARAGTNGGHGDLPLWQAITAYLHQPATLLGFALYGVGAILWLAVLSRWEVSKAYPLVGLGFVASLAVGAALGEQITPTRLIGVLMIASGVAVLSRT